ncbi:MAG: NAD(P)H-hydrate dehydratase [Nitrospinae bacterium]|nr:NAD(P)H-hydrate dehydratase [Nitrospinota bacterium]MBL7019407.1 NAD(P)H-hydrate dehydratase [Nitrospinaceae bacterium]
MLPVVTAKQMQAIDRQTIDEFGIPGITLMENAGVAVVHELQKRFPDLSHKKVFIFCGKGNNGGDGFVIARHLFNLGSEVQVLLTGKLSKLKGDAETNANSARNIGVQVDELDVDNLNCHDHKLRHCDIIIDAVFGTGLNKPVSGFMEKVIDKINQFERFEKFVVSVDINSGVDSDSGQLIGPHVKSDLTLALAYWKQSHLLHPSAGVMQEVRLLDIGVPEKASEQQSIQVHQSTVEDIKSYFQKRDPNSHKGNYGHVLVLAGSRGKEGAAGLTALAVLRAGAGLCTLALPASSQKAMHPMEVMTVPLPETANGSLSLKAKQSILDLLKDKSVVAIGPGISTDPETVALIGELLPQIRCPLVLDADALNALSLHKDWLKKLQPETVLTPHPKEMSRLIGVPTEEIQRNRVETASRFAREHSLNLVLKGSPSLIALPDGSLVINPTGNPGMATGGSGDVLTGIISGLIAQGLSSSQASIAGTYIHGQAGDHFAERESQTTLIAGDLLRCLPETLKRILP